MVKKRTPYMLCMSLLILNTLTYQSNAVQDIPLITAKQCWAACKKISKITTAIGVGYWLMRTILDNGISHTDTTTYPSTAQKLSVITDGEVTIRKSNDDKTHVTHCYGGLWGSHLPSLYFNENFNGKKLEIHGHTTPTHRSFLTKILEFLFCLNPERTLHHIIEIPDSRPSSSSSASRDPYSVAIDITTTNSLRKNFVVVIDSLVNAINIHAHTGNVRVTCPKEYAQLSIVHTHPAGTVTHPTSSDGNLHSRMASLHEPIWVRRQVPCQPANPIEIHTPDKVVVENFQGNLHIFDDGQQFPDHQQQICLTRHSQNHCGKVFINGSEQPYSIRYSYPDKETRHLQHATVTSVAP